MATGNAPNVHDPEAMRLAGIALEDCDAVVMKSGMHFHLSFADLCPTASVATPGLATDQLATLPFEHVRPIYPLDDVAWKKE